MRLVHAWPALFLSLASGCPANTPELELVPEVPEWTEGASPKAFRAFIKDRQGRKVTARVFYKRRAVNVDTEVKCDATAAPGSADVFEFVLPESHRPETFLRTQIYGLENLKLAVSAAERPLIDQLLSDVTALREQTLYSLMHPPEKK